MPRLNRKTETLIVALAYILVILAGVVVFWGHNINWWAILN